MLQYITQPENKYSIAEQCQMVIEGGCGWIQLHVPDFEDSQIRELASEIIPLCKESSTILVIEDKIELAKELGLHGVHLCLNSGLNAHKIRLDFGPEIIIGLEVTDPQSILSMKDADIDYVTLPSFLNDERKKEIVDIAALSNNVIPVVFEGDYCPKNVLIPLADGASGVSTGRLIAEAQNPVEFTAEIISKLTYNV